MGEPAIRIVKFEPERPEGERDFDEEERGNRDGDQGKHF